MDRRQFLRTTGLTLSATALGTPYIAAGRAQAFEQPPGVGGRPQEAGGLL